MQQSSLVKSVSLIFVAMILSRITGVLRETAVAYRFGTSADVDAYLIALVIPVMLFNFIYVITQNTFIPVYAPLKGKEEGDSFFNGFFCWTLAGVLLVTGLIYGFAPQVVAVVAPGFTGENFDLTVRLSRILIPGVIFMGLGGLLNGYYHSHQSFFMPQFVYVVQNVIIVVTALVMVGENTEKNIDLLTWGTLLGLSALLWCLLPGMRRLGFKLRRPKLFHPAIKQMAGLMPPVVLGGAAQQLKAIIDNAFASMLASGSVAALNYANRLYQLPLGLYTMSITTVLFPTMVELLEKKDVAGFKQKIAQGFGVIYFLSIPTVVGMIVLREPLVSVLFERGAFDAGATANTAYAMAFFSLGLITVGAKELLSFAFFAMKDTRTPMKANFLVLGLNGGLNYLLMQYLGHGGIALASGLAAGAGAGYLYVLLKRQVGPLVQGELGASLVKTTLAALGMGGVLLAALPFVELEAVIAGFKGQLLELGLLVGGGTAVYLALCRLVGVRELNEVIRLVQQKFKNKIQKT